MTLTQNVEMQPHGLKNVARINAVMLPYTKEEQNSMHPDDIGDPEFVTISCIDAGTAPERFTEEIR